MEASIYEMGRDRGLDMLQIRQRYIEYNRVDDRILG